MLEVEAVGSVNCPSVIPSLLTMCSHDAVQKETTGLRSAGLDRIIWCLAKQS